MSLSVDNIHLLAVNAGYAIHEGDWNWKKVSSPFSRMYYVTEGSAQIELPDGIHELKPGYMYFVPSFVLHSNICDSHFEHYYMHIYEDGMTGESLFEDWEFPLGIEAGEFELSLFRKFCEMNPQMSLAESNPESYDNSVSLSENIRTSKNRLLSERLASRGIINFLVSRFLQKASKRYDVDDDRIKKVLSHIRKNIGSQFEVTELAAMACLSTDHFIRMFKKAKNETPMQYIIRSKIERAQLILSTEDVPLKEVAIRLGFEDVSYFNRQFKKIVGIPPQQYRLQTR